VTVDCVLRGGGIRGFCVVAESCSCCYSREKTNADPLAWAAINAQNGERGSRKVLTHSLEVR